MPTITFDITDEQLDRLAADVLRNRIEEEQLNIEVHANFAINGELADDIQSLFHLMHAYNYLTPPSEHYDVPTP